MSKVRRMFPVESSMIDSIGFIPLHQQTGNGIMLVRFKNGDVYRYDNVSCFSYVTMMNAVSIGQEFKVLSSRVTIKTTKLTHGEALEFGINVVKGEAATQLIEDVKKALKKNADDLPMLDVMGVESTSRVGKVSSVNRGKGGRK